MAEDLFLNGLVSIEQVESIYRSCIADLSAGEVIVSWSSEGTSVTKLIPMSATNLATQCIRFLRKYAPEKYGRKITSTRGYFI